MNDYICAGLMLAAAVSARADLPTLTVHASVDVRDTPLTAFVPSLGRSSVVRLTSDGQQVTAQVRRASDRSEITWVQPALREGESVTYRVEPLSARPAGKGVEVVREGANLAIRIDGEPFATYDTTTGPNKPYFYPVFGPDQKHMTRGYPIEKLPGDTTTDHPHHRGLWFTHGDVNGVDYWSEGGKTGKTVNRKYEQIVSGPVYGGFRATTDWIAPDGTKVAQDVREVRVYAVPEGRILDFTVTIKPVGKPMVFGDTKEGSFGLRIPDTMRAAVERGRTAEGHIVTSTGLTDGAAWGKRADWVDYFGPTDGAVEGVAIFDNPANLRHPTYWHVRDYGLFAANPFGIHDFVPGQPPGAGKYTVEVGQSITFSYRVLFHRGTADDAHLAEVWNGYASPPTMSLDAK